MLQQECSHMLTCMVLSTSRQSLSHNGNNLKPSHGGNLYVHPNHSVSSTQNGYISRTLDTLNNCRSDTMVTCCSATAGAQLVKLYFILHVALAGTGIHLCINQCDYIICVVYRIVGKFGGQKVWRIVSNSPIQSSIYN